jgi:hypothetical protein
MRILGQTTAVALAVTSAGLGLLVVMSWPDVRRYLRIRNM